MSDRVKYIRTIMDELQRIDSHLLFYSCLAMDLGALTAFFYGFRDREKILDIFEETCGGRLIMNYMVRMDEIMESMNILEQLIDNIPEGPYQEKMKPIIRVPEGQYYAAVEGSRGEFGVFLESHGDKTPYRLHFRSTGLPLVSTVDTICRGSKIADLIAIGGTLDYVVPDIDR